MTTEKRDEEKDSKAQNIQAVRLIPRVAKKLRYQNYTTGETASTMIRDVIAKYTEDGTDMPPRERRTERFSLWMTNKEWMRASRRAKLEGHVLTDVIEYELEKMLDNS
jgi:predicted DNA-binding protein